MASALIDAAAGTIFWWVGVQFVAMGKLLAIAIAMALSSVPIMATLIILLSPQRRRSSLPFLAGWVASLAVVALAAAAGVLAMPLSRRERGQVAAAAEIVAGAALVIGAILTWRRSRPGASSSGGHLAALGSYGAGGILRGLRACWACVPRRCCWASPRVWPSARNRRRLREVG